MAGYFQVATTSLILNTKTNLFLSVRKPNKNTWTLPGGRIEQGEDIEKALKREIFEETGITDVIIEKILWAYHGFRGEQRPENEIIVIQYFIKTNQTDITISEEHTEYKWMTLDHLKLNLSESICQALNNYLNTNTLD